MNSLDKEPGSGGDEEPPIVLVAIDDTSFYLFKGEEHINQILLADGEFPKPVLCVHFKSVYDAKTMIGAAFNVSQCWAINPAIIERLRTTNCLIETDA